MANLDENNTRLNLTQPELNNSDSFIKKHLLALSLSSFTGLSVGIALGLAFGVFAAIPTGGLSFLATLIAVLILGGIGFVVGGLFGLVGSWFRDYYQGLHKERVIHNTENTENTENNENNRKIHSIKERFLLYYLDTDPVKQARSHQEAETNIFNSQERSPSLVLESILQTLWGKIEHLDRNYIDNGVRSIKLAHDRNAAFQTLLYYYTEIDRDNLMVRKLEDEYQRQLYVDVPENFTSFESFMAPIINDCVQKMRSGNYTDIFLCNAEENENNRAVKIALDMYFNEDSNISVQQLNQRNLSAEILNKLNNWREMLIDADRRQEFNKKIQSINVQKMPKNLIGSEVDHESSADFTDSLPQQVAGGGAASVSVPSRRILIIEAVKLYNRDINHAAPTVNSPTGDAQTNPKVVALIDRWFDSCIYDKSIDEVAGGNFPNRHQIMPGIWVGNKVSVGHIEYKGIDKTIAFKKTAVSQLVRDSIGGIICVAHNIEVLIPPEQIPSMTIPLPDEVDITNNELLFRYMPKAIKFIEDLKKSSNGGVLIHCNAGMSRSVTVLAGILMKTYGLTFQSAYSRIFHNRPVARPKFWNFLHQYQILIWMENKYMSFFNENEANTCKNGIFINEAGEGYTLNEVINNLKGRSGDNNLDERTRNAAIGTIDYIKDKLKSAEIDEHTAAEGHRNQELFGSIAGGGASAGENNGGRAPVVQTAEALRANSMFAAPVTTTREALDENHNSTHNSTP